MPSRSRGAQQPASKSAAPSSPITDAFAAAALLLLTAGLGALSWPVLAPPAVAATPGLSAVRALPAQPSLSALRLPVTATAGVAQVAAQALPAVRPPAPIAPAQQVLALADRTGSRVLGQVQALDALPPVPPLPPGLDPAQAFAWLLDGRVQHLRRCDDRRCEIWIAGVAGVAGGSGAAASASPAPQAPAVSAPPPAPAVRPPAPTVPTAPVAPEPPQPDPPGLFPAD